MPNQIPTSADTIGGTNQAPLVALDGDTKFEYNILRYPPGVGRDTDSLHYVMFYIDLPESSKYVENNPQSISSNATIPSVKNFNALGRNNSPLSLGQVGEATLTTTVGSVISGQPSQTTKGTGSETLAVGAVTAYAIDLKPKLKRINTAMAIYVPDTIVMDYQHSYQEESVTQALGALGEKAAIGAGAIGAIGTTFENIGSFLTGGSINKYSAGPAASEAAISLAAKTGLINKEASLDLALRGKGQAVNPQVELIFKGTKNREFTFEFKFVAKSREEMKTINNIIYTFRRFAAPEFNGDNGGRYFTTPAQFDISFYFGNTENTNIPRISTCVLENINVNYAGGGKFATFNDGMPVDINMALRFRETDIMYRQLIEQFYY